MLSSRLAALSKTVSPRDTPACDRARAVAPNAAGPDRTRIASALSVLDAIMEGYVEGDISPRDIVAQGYAHRDVERVCDWCAGRNTNRRQSPVASALPRAAFGQGTAPSPITQ